MAGPLQLPNGLGFFFFFVYISAECVLKMSKVSQYISVGRRKSI